eukprot:8669260-Alexandrium_andersonii.AAC.1
MEPLGDWPSAAGPEEPRRSFPAASSSAHSREETGGASSGSGAAAELRLPAPPLGTEDQWMA